MIDRAAIILDGASAFMPVGVPTETYVDTLGHQVADILEHRPTGILADVVAESISATANALNLKPGASPSSTVAIVRQRAEAVDLYALGDSAIYYAIQEHTHRLSDGRIAELGIPEHHEYRERLAQGHGYDTEHRRLLEALQRQQRAHRNRPGGYWIAEADPAAGHHALTHAVPFEEIGWAVLASDGAYGPVAHLGLDDWPWVARLDSAGLAALLKQCADWETTSDLHGQAKPRSKIADDKTLVSVGFADS